MKNCSYSIILTFLFGCSLTLKGQVVTILPPVINPFDCVSALELYAGTFLLEGDRSFNVFLEGQISYGTTFENQRIIAEGTTATFSLSPGSTTISAQNAEGLLTPVDYTFNNKDLERTYFNTGCLVPGFYELCVQVRDKDFTFGDRNILGETCYSFEIQSATPLLLISPFPESQIEIPLPIFTWTPVLPRMDGATYTLQLVEVLGFQTPFEAFRSNPILFQQEGLFTNVFQYPVSARPLEPCRKFAWQVGYTTFGRRRIQQSEVWEFETGCKEELIEKPRKKKTIPDASLDYSYIVMQSEEAGSYYPILHNQLRFAIQNRYEQKTELNYSIIDSKGKVVVSEELILNENPTPPEVRKRPDSTVKRGENQFWLSLDELGLKSTEYYTLKVEGFKIPYYLRFRIIE